MPGRREVSPIWISLKSPRGHDARPSSERQRQKEFKLVPIRSRASRGAPRSRQIEARERGRRLPRDLRRGELIQAAIKVMGERGDTGARVSDVTTAAGVAKGTFYVHFQSWDDLVVAVRDHVADGFRRGVMLRAANIEGAAWPAFIEDEAVLFIDALIAMGPLHEAIFHGPAAFKPTKTPNPFVALIETLLKRGASDGAFALENTRAAALLLFSVWHATADAIAAKAGRARHLAALRQLMRKWLSAP